MQRSLAPRSVHVKDVINRCVAHNLDTTYDFTIDAEEVSLNKERLSRNVKSRTRQLTEDQIYLEEIKRQKDEFRYKYHQMVDKY